MLMLMLAFFFLPGFVLGALLVYMRMEPRLEQLRNSMSRKRDQRGRFTK